MFQKMEYVYAVYKEHSFTRAAEKLYISQPCLSAAIKKIENEIGMPLFERRYSDLRLTEIGQEYIATAEKMMDLQAEFAARVKDLNDLECGSITVGGSNYVMSYVIPPIVSRFSQLYPRVSISLVETSSVELGKKLGNEEIDLVIDSFDDEAALYDCCPLLDEKILLAVPAGSKSNEALEQQRITAETIFHLDAGSVQPVSVEHFREENFILLKSGNNMYEHAMAVFRQGHISPKVSFWLDQLNTSYALTASGNGVCFVTDTFFKYNRLKNDVYLYNVEGSGSRTLYIARKRNRYASNAMKAFTDIARKTVTG